MSRPARVTLSQVEIADVLAEGWRRIEAEHPTMAAQGEHESDAAYALRVAGVFIDLFCELKAGPAFDRAIYDEHALQLAGLGDTER